MALLLRLGWFGDRIFNHFCRIRAEKSCHPLQNLFLTTTLPRLHNFVREGHAKECCLQKQTCPLNHERQHYQELAGTKSW